ncbi:MAG: PcfB family protein [Defluviitaleaceae bacterium]|nr:PcfB family protein [Defluviitaleaceae bacterium]
MINEEVAGKSVEVAVRISNLSLDLILKGLDFLKKKLEGTPDKPLVTAKQDGVPDLKHGKQTLQELHKHNEGISTIELTNPNLRELNRTMKKADIDFSVVKDGKGKYTLFFKGKNADEMTRAFKQYSKKMVKIADKKAIKTELTEAKTAAKALDAGRDKEKKKDRGAR